VIYYIYRNKWYYGKMPAGPYYGPILYCQDGGTEWREVPGIKIERRRAVNERHSKRVERLPDNAIAHEKRKSNDDQ
jgi:hypothetical protein